MLTQISRMCAKPMMTSLTWLMSTWLTSATSPSTKTQPPKNILASQKSTCSAVILSSPACTNWNSMPLAAEMTWFLCSIWWYIYFAMVRCQDTRKTKPVILIHCSSTPSKLKWTKHPRTSASIKARTCALSKKKSSVTVLNRCLTIIASAQFFKILEIKRGP